MSTSKGMCEELIMQKIAEKRQKNIANANPSKARLNGIAKIEQGIYNEKKKTMLYLVQKYVLQVQNSN